MDIERVNIVFNYDMPEDSDTYLHRVARAGRFGTKGLAITFVSDEWVIYSMKSHLFHGFYCVNACSFINVFNWIWRGDAKILNEVQDRFDVNITELPDEIDLSSYSKFQIQNR